MPNEYLSLPHCLRSDIETPYGFLLPDSPDGLQDARGNACDMLVVQHFRQKCGPPPIDSNTFSFPPVIFNFLLTSWSMAVVGIPLSLKLMMYPSLNRYTGIQLSEMRIERPQGRFPKTSATFPAVETMLCAFTAGARFPPSLLCTALDAHTAGPRQ